MSTVVVQRPAHWRIVLAAVFDFFMVFIGGGLAIAYLTGGMTQNGFRLEGGPALALFALIAVYFFVGGKLLGGTLWQRVLRTRR